MRDFAVVSPRFWTGNTGRQIKKLGPESQIVALYLMTAPGSNLIGLYYLPLPVLCHETGCPIEGALKALRCLSEVGFAHYSEAEEVVWVVEMARYQLGSELKPGDKRHARICKELASHGASEFYGVFLQRYADAFRLDNMPPPQCPSDAPPKPLGWVPRADQDQDQDQDTDQEKNSFCAATDKPLAPPPVLEFPCNGKPGTWSLTEAQVSEWEALYPGLDIRAESRKALAWIKANQRKTAKGMPRFLVGWFGRANDRRKNGNGGDRPEYFHGQPIIPLSSVAPSELTPRQRQQRALAESREQFRAGAIDRQEWDRRMAEVSKLEDPAELRAFTNRYRPTDSARGEARH